LTIRRLAITRNSLRSNRSANARVRPVSIASFIVSSAHGGGWMLVPALMPLCVGTGAALGRGTTANALWLAAAAVVVHSVAMLAVAAGLASGVCGGAASIRRRFCGR